VGALAQYFFVTGRGGLTMIYAISEQGKSGGGEERSGEGKRGRPMNGSRKRREKLWAARA